MLRKAAGHRSEHGESFVEYAMKKDKEKTDKEKNQGPNNNDRFAHHHKRW